MLPGGRKVRVLAYDNGEVRFHLDGTPYVMSECFLAGSSGGHAIIKLSPGRQGSAVPRKVAAPVVDES